MNDREQRPRRNAAPDRAGAPTAGMAESDATTGMPSGGDPAAGAEVREGPGSRIGPYKLLHLIGEGGFGSVFMAEQSEPIRRHVALKIIKLGMDTRRVVARFEQERQALALMDHPNIAKVLDAGATESGRPFFVMELVKGEPISTFCDRNGLDIDARLKLIAEVCVAVQHAHTKGIIHRDLKPSNILVSMQDGRAAAKVIDFGIAKATDSRLTDKTIRTELHQLIGTPSYMSPEQAGGSLDIDTRTDVYALGVVLYELLTGSTPFDPKTLQSATLVEIQRIIREVEPPRPSTRLSRNADALAEVAARRRTERGKLVATVRGELDWIVMKALDKDRTRRYESAGEMALDVRRYLACEAVVAAPPGTGYRLRKFVRRHRGAVSAGVAVAAALLIGLAGFAWQASVASGQRDRALEAEAAARARAEEIKLVADFQAGMLEQVDPATAGRQLTADVNRRFTEALARDGVPEADLGARTREFSDQWSRVNATDAAVALIDQTILRPAVAVIDVRFADQPAVAAQLRQTLADRYRALGLFDDAQPLQAAALESRRRLFGDDSPETVVSISHMGLLLMDLGLLDEAEPYFREAVERTPRVLGPEDGETIDAITNLGVLLEAQGRLTDAEPYYREALEKRRRVFGEDDPGTPIVIGNLGYLLESQGKLDEAEPLYREALEKSRRLRGEDDAFTLASLGNLGALLHTQGRLDEAEPFYRDALQGYRRAMGEDHPATVRAVANLGVLLKYQGRLAEAEPYYREALEKKRRSLGQDHPSTLTSVHNLGALLLAQDRTAEAERTLQEAVDARRRTLGPGHPATLNSIITLGGLLQSEGKNAAAVQLLSGSESDARETFTDAKAVQLARLLLNLGKARAAQGDQEAAVANLSEARAIFVAAGESSLADAQACSEALSELSGD